MKKKQSTFPRLAWDQHTNCTARSLTAKACEQTLPVRGLPLGVGAFDATGVDALLAASCGATGDPALIMLLREQARGEADFLF